MAGLWRKMAGWLVHGFTASGAFAGLLALLAVHEGHLLGAFWLMGMAIVIDAVDGVMARWIRVREVIPQIDGALLDNIVDFFTYTLVPAFFLLVVPLIPSSLKMACVLAIVFSSAYQFTHIEAKTRDHFFRGFPSYWNIVVFYLFLWQMKPLTNAVIIFLLALLSFVPVKYVYPSRLDYLTESAVLRFAMLAATIIWGLATAGLLWLYPETGPVFVFFSGSYLVLYVCISLYRTFVPLSPKIANL
jgi:phosphatidylcholine synthase